jgi:hypothetical protein
MGNTLILAQEKGVDTYSYITDRNNTYIPFASMEKRILKHIHHHPIDIHKDMAGYPIYSSHELPYTGIAEAQSSRIFGMGVSRGK